MKNPKTCSFFVSNTHLLTIILPYINEKMNEGKNVNVISQTDLSEDVKKYLKSVKKFNEESLKMLSWKNKNEENFDADVALVIGDEKFIRSINIDNIEDVVECYKIESIDIVKDIIEEYDYYLRTDGKLKIIKNSQNEQNSNTIKSQL